jgi:tRNA (Thr-GGU) A37 N-methylase
MDLSRYKFYIDEANRKVIAVSTYAGKNVKGIAKCSPDDTFDIEKGKQLAAARCNIKIAEKRYKRAVEKLEEADYAFINAQLHYDKMNRYYCDSYEDVMNSMRELSIVTASM